MKLFYTCCLALCIFSSQGSLAATDAPLPPILYITNANGNFHFQLCRAQEDCKAIGRLTTDEYRTLLGEMRRVGSEELVSYGRWGFSFLASLVTSLPVASVVHRQFRNSYMTAFAIVIVTTLYANYGARSYLLGATTRPALIKQMAMLLDARLPQSSSIAIEMTGGEVWSDLQDLLSHVPNGGH